MFMFVEVWFSLVQFSYVVVWIVDECVYLLCAQVFVFCLSLTRFLISALPSPHFHLFWQPPRETGMKTKGQRKSKGKRESGE